MVNKINCNLCDDDFAGFLYSLGPRRVVKCRNCGHMYVNPQPSLDELEKVYQEYFKDVKDPDGKSRNWLKEKDAKIREHRKEIKELERFKSNGRILDVGCGAGFFLSALRSSWEKYGLEFDTEMSEYAKENFGLEVFNGELKDSRYEAGFFDVVNMAHAIEHMQDPFSNLLKANEILKKGGLLVVSTPNVGSFCYNVFKEKFRLMYDPGHIHFFSARILKLMLKKAGFKVICVKYPFFNTAFFNRNEVYNLIKRVPVVFFNRHVRKTGNNLVSPPFYGNVVRIYCVKS